MARVASMGENSTSWQSGAAWATAARAWPLTSSRVVWSWCSMWMSDVEMKVWIRGRAASRPAVPAAARAAGVAHGVPGGVDVGYVRARQAGDDRALDLAGDGLHGLEVPR